MKKAVASAAFFLSLFGAHTAAQTISGGAPQWHATLFKVVNNPGSYTPITNTIDIMIVSAGGGGGGGCDSSHGGGSGGGGGAAGWALPRTSIAVTPFNTLTIHVGAHGSGAICDSAGMDGSASWIASSGPLPIPPPGSGGKEGSSTLGGQGGINASGAGMATAFGPQPAGSGGGASGPNVLPSFPFIQGTPGGNGADSPGGTGGGAGQSWTSGATSGGGTIGGGGGGGSFVGKGGSGGSAGGTPNGASCSGTNYGGGGGGGGQFGTGGDGCDGLVVIWEFY